jgi:Na+-transporting NADH:ubiquinone oxidoreductase subunit NqrB
MTIEGMAFLMAVYWDFILFIMAITFKYARNSPAYEPAVEVLTHFVAVSMQICLIIHSLRYNLPQFVALGGVMLAILVTNYIIELIKAGNRK